jgi:hypothetical protein
MFMYRAPRSPATALAAVSPREDSSMAEKVPILVVIGLDIDGKPHASRFADGDARLVQRAAELMGFHVIQLTPDQAELHALAEGLPLGKIFASGRAFVPFVARAAFDKLATLVDGGVTIEQRAASGAPPVYPLADMFTTDAINTADALWSKVEVGTVVLAAQPDVYGPGWWEAVVVSVDGDDLGLRWMAETALPPFRASRRQVALRHPGAD